VTTHDQRWTVFVNYKGEQAPSLLDRGVLAASIYRPGDVELTERIAALLNADEDARVAVAGSATPTEEKT
jgi:hypothetical protein